MRGKARFLLAGHPLHVAPKNREQQSLFHGEAY